MKFFSYIFFLTFAGILVSSAVIAQPKGQDETVTINGVKYIVYQVKSGETLYSLCKKYGISENELKMHNPELALGFKAGMKLNIPLTDKSELNQPAKKSVSDPDSFIIHTIEKQETPYFVARKYGITVEDIFNYNSGLKKFDKGKNIRIPQWTKGKYAEAEKPVERKGEKEKEEFTEYRVKQGETLYSISKSYQVEIPEILLYNPEARNLKEGTVLKLPVKGENQGKMPVNSEVEKGFILHIIESGETLFGITRMYDVSKEELIDLNPDIEKKFQAGQVIKVPLNETYRSEIKESKENPDLVKYTVKKGETISSISSGMNVPVVDIKKYNPALNFRGLAEGEVLFLPASAKPVPVQTIEIQDDSTKQVPVVAEKTGPVTRIPKGCQPDRRNNPKKINVALFLPLFLDENEEVNEEIIRITSSKDSSMVDLKKESAIDSTQQNIAKQTFFKNSENFLYFYEGALIALDSLRKEGVPVSLTVYDSRQDGSGIKKIIASEKLKEANLIIGPVLPEHQADLSAYAAKNRITMVSPLASTSGGIKNNSHFFQVNPTREYLYAQTANLIARDYSGSNLVVLKNGPFDKTPEGSLVDMLEEKLTNAGYYSNNSHLNLRIYDVGKNGISGLKGLLSKEKENVLYIATMDEAKVSETLSGLKNMAADYSITLIGNRWYPQFKSINQELFHILKLKYLSPYWVNYNEAGTVNYVRTFRNLYKTEPDEYGFQGFDVTYFFCSAMASYGKDFYGCLNYINGEMTQGKYHFGKVSEMGGYMNHGLSLISFEPDYSVVCRKIIGQPVLVAGN